MEVYIYFIQSEIWSSKNDKKVLELLKIFVLKNEAFKENYDQENTDIVVFLRNKKTNNFGMLQMLYNS